MHFLMRYVFPVQGQASYADKLADLCCGAPKLNFLPVKYTKPATFKWKDEPGHASSVLKKQASLNNAQDVIIMELASLLSLVLFIFTIFSFNLNHTISASNALSALTYGFFNL